MSSKFVRFAAGGGKQQSQPAKALGLAWRSPGTSSPSSTAARWKSTAGSVNLPNLRSACHAKRWEARCDGQHPSGRRRERRGRAVSPTFSPRAATRDVCGALRQLSEDALGKLAGGVEPTLIAILSDINMPEMDGSNCSARSNDAIQSCRWQTSRRRQRDGEGTFAGTAGTGKMRRKRPFAHASSNWEDLLRSGGDRERLESAQQREARLLVAAIRRSW
jgi:CheY-like chemotaxis protein